MADLLDETVPAQARESARQLWGREVGEVLAKMAGLKATDREFPAEEGLEHFAQALRRLQESLQKRGALPCLTRQSRSVTVSVFTVSGRPAKGGPQGRRCESAATPSL